MADSAVNAAVAGSALTAGGDGAEGTARAKRAAAAAGGRAGRRPSAVWEFFTELRTPSGKVHARCNYCERQCAGVAARMVRHIVSKCPGAPEDAALVLGEASAASIAAKRRRILSAGRGDASSSLLLPDQQSPSELLSASLVTPSAGQGVGISANTAAATDDSASLVSELALRHAATSIAGGYAVLEATTLHRHLVLACVLHDVPPAFVEDEALWKAFAVARPGLPPLRAEMAQTTVLGELHNVVQARVARAMAQAASVTLVYRHFTTGQPGVVVDQIVGVDDRRASMLLYEQVRQADAATDGGCCLSVDAVDAIVQKLSEQVPAEAVVNLCVDCRAVLTVLQTRRAAAPSPPDVAAFHQSASDLALPEDATTIPPPTVQPPPTRRSTALLGTCLLRQSLVLRKELLSAFPPLVDVLGQAALLAHSIVGNVHVGFHLRQQLHSVLAAAPPSAAAWDFHARLVKRVLALEQDVRAVTIASASTQDEFWARLREADALLTPFSWMLALSHVKSASTGQFVVLWLWVLALVDASPLVAAGSGPDEDEGATSTRAKFVDVAMRTIRSSCGDGHPLVCLLLDPRTRGAGLSATGRRHVKSLVVRVAARLAPDLAEGEGRAKLLDQLSHFVERSAQFGDEIAWEMSVGRDPALFWDDFSADTQELTRVARCVLAFPAVAQDVDEFLGTCSRDDRAAWGQTFAVRQIKHQFWKNGHNRGSSTRHRHCGSRSDSVADAHRELLAPPVPMLALGGAGIDAEDGDKQLPPVVPADAAVEVFVLEQIQQLALLDDELLGRQSSDGDAAEEAAAIPIGIDWFAVTTPADRAALEQAVARFLPGAAL